MNHRTDNPEVQRYVDKLMGQLGDFHELQQRLLESQEVGVAAAGLVEVTVGPTGNLLGVRLDPRAMRLASQDLSEAIMEAFTKATTQLGERVTELMRPLLPEGVAAGDGLAGAAGLKVMGLDGAADDPVQAAREALRRAGEGG